MHLVPPRELYKGSPLFPRSRISDAVTLEDVVQEVQESQDVLSILGSIRQIKSLADTDELVEDAVSFYLFDSRRVLKQVAYYPPYKNIHMDLSESLSSQKSGTTTQQKSNQLLAAKDQPPSEERTLCQPLHCSPKGVSTLFDPPAEVLCPAVTPTTDVTRITQQFLPDALSRVCASTQTDKTDVTEMRCQAGIAEIKTHYACTVELDQPYSMLSADVSSEGMAPPQETPLQQETLPPQRSLE
ncbi:uncharacterized protein [Apostichopus japonicus]|uniref:uncharacterized protein n=1 Tax=Stichopus japonicus TaxID=307972 RepID=UPI003AB655C3